MKIDIGRLTQDETKALMRECMDNVVLEDVIAALLTYSEDDREEIIASLEVHRPGGDDA